MEWVSCRGRPEASFSQGDAWKRLISRYIQAMPPIGSMLCAEEQIVACGAAFAESHAISAKVGEAARPSQPAASQAVCQARALLFFVIIDVVIFDLSTRLAVAGWAKMYGRVRDV